MTERQVLPIGTVVRVKKASENLMISTLFPVTEKNGERGYFDFGAVPLPLGVTNEQTAFFNKEDIEEVVFVGYIDIHFQQLTENYDAIVSGIEYPKLTVAAFNQKD
ncbi:DUF4176 domain-containing protein [Streptococcus loxodontisalivarius]|uniref:DUF4176 domain-containing protein n=1 Tax=Streptococcus loxodontisalivarius TaxID=1349415 RepID=A0ABS2PUA6_9STRE|nr:DUF4176 domain-containing protein [Streptococcus loxodontisalivarius]MBM7643054.1 hypothetical protein [Streptococcus loxodontisalivarius]